jgi:hypothetical protein
MNPNDIAPVIISIVFMITSGGVILLRPITKRLGTYLEVLAVERRQALQRPAPGVAPQTADTARMLTLLESMDDRMQRLEDRQDFTDRLLTTRPNSGSLPNG